MAKIYVGTVKNLIDNGSAVEIAKILVGLVENQDSITFTQDADGPYFAVSDDTLKAFEAVTSEDGEKPVKRGPGRPRKNPEPEPQE